MGASNHPDLRFPKDRGRGVESELADRRAKAHERDVYKRVTERDRYKCTCCYRSGNPSATTTLGKLHHDHILERSLGGVTESFNVALLCWLCHDFKTSHQIEPTGNPDTGTLTYTITAAAAEVVFKNRVKPAHVRIVEANA